MAEIYTIQHTIDAKHVKNIGEQSVSSSVQAVLEMVKNSYDGDADNCTVHFYAKTSLAQYLDVYKIVVEDDGIGMTFKDIENKWMRIGTENKERESLSPVHHRRVSGEKGMGHFATQKLGNKLKLVSDAEMYKDRESSKFSDKTLTLTINWEKYKPGLLFNEIKNELEVTKRDNPDNHGVSIEITNLRDEWILDDIEKVQINLGNLMLPKYIRKNLKHPFNVKVVAHGFSLNEEIESTVEKFAPWEIKCTLKGSMAHYTIYKLNKRLGKRFPAQHINDRAPGKGNFPMGDKTCGDATFTLLFYRGRAGGAKGWLPKTVMKKSEIERQLKDNCGIKIFNDGVRVMPYGNPGNDWVGLSERKVRSFAGKLRNQLSMGFVFLSRENNPQIIETTTRQALVENFAFESLKKNFVLRTIEKLEMYLHEAKLDKDEVVEDTKNKASSEIKQIRDFIEKLDIPISEKKAQQKKLSEIDRLLEKQETDFELIEEEITGTLEMYRNLSSLGISALAFHHELVQPVARIEARQSKLIDKWYSWDDGKKLDYIEKSLKDIWTIDDLNTYIREFAALFKGAKGVMRKREEINIKNTLKRLQEGFENILESHKIEIEVVQGSGSFSGMYMNLASFESIILNLVSNSIRALLKVSRTQKKIRFSYQKNLGNLEIRIKDNGFGIEEDNFEQIFNPFWTTFKGNSEYGTGMGTTIVREILEDDYDGTIHVEKSVYDPDDLGKGRTTMLIKIPLDELKKGK